MRGLGRKLRHGVPVINMIENSLDIVSTSGDVMHRIPERDLSDQDYGYVYERCVGLYFEAQGYEVTYRGLEGGFFDEGIDLIATRSDELPTYIQCKLKRKSRIGKQACEKILYKADLFLRKVFPKSCARPVGRFVLAVPSLRDAFFSKIKSNGREYYPIADYFISKNNIQKMIRLEIIEIPFI